MYVMQNMFCHFCVSYWYPHRGMKSSPQVPTRVNNTCAPVLFPLWCVYCCIAAIYLLRLCPYLMQRAKRGTGREHFRKCTTVVCQQYYCCRDAPCVRNMCGSTSSGQHGRGGGGLQAFKLRPTPSCGAFKFMCVVVSSVLEKMSRRSRPQVDCSGSVVFGRV